MKILVMGAGMMGWAAAFDMVRTSRVETVTLADSNSQRLDDAVARINKLTGNHKVTPMQVDAADTAAVLQLMRGHDGVLSAVPYFFNLELAKAAIEAGCHFADLGGNNTVVKQEFALHDQAQAAGVAIAPDCGLSPGMASILGGELLRRIGGKADALKIYVGGLATKPASAVQFPARLLRRRPDQRVQRARQDLARRKAAHGRAADRSRT